MFEKKKSTLQYNANCVIVLHVVNNLYRCNLIQTIQSMSLQNKCIKFMSQISSLKVKSLNSVRRNL